MGAWVHALYFLVLIGLALGAVFATWPARDMEFDFAVASGFAAAFFATRLLTIRLPQGDDVYVTLVVGLSALAVADITTVLAAYAVAAAVESVARYTQSMQTAALYRALDAIRGLTVIGIMSPWQLVIHPLVTAQRTDDTIIVWVLVSGVAYSGLDILTMAMQQRIAGGLPVTQGIATLQRPLITMYLVHLPMAAVAVRLYADSGVWALPIALLMTLILQNSFNLYLRIRRGYADTISALAHAAELDRPHDSGHARRVADLSVAVGRRMGLSSHDLERIGYAALLHDVGRMGDVGEDSSGVHAHRGAEIVGTIPFLADVAPLIDQPDAGRCGTRPVGAEVVWTCSRYDRLRAEVGAHAALERLVLEAGGMRGRVLETLDDVVRGQNSWSGASR